MPYNDFLNDAEYFSSPRSDPFASPYDTALSTGFADQNTVVPYLRKNTQENLDDSLTWGEMFDSAWTGVKTGIGSYAPERFYRALRTVGSMIGSDSLQEWAGQGIEENVRERSEDPWYIPDESWMQKEWGRALYEGFANFTAGLTTMAPGVLATMAAAPLAAPAAGGMLGSMLLMRGASFLGGAAFSNTLMGFSEFDSFVDDAYSELSRNDPNVTRETIRSDKFWQVVLSGVAEGGIGMASDAIAGKLTGILGKETGKQASHLVTRLIKNTYRNVITEMGEEAATAYIQDYAKELADLDYEGRWQAIQNIIKPTLVAGVLGGASKTAFGSVQDAIKQDQPAPSAPDVDGLISKVNAGKAREVLSPHAFDTMQGLVATDGLSHSDALATTTALDALANRIASETGEGAATVFKGQDAHNPGLRRMVQAVQNKDLTIDQAAVEVFDYLHSRLAPEGQEGISRTYGDLDTATDAFRQYLRGDSVAIPDDALRGFSSMKSALADVVNATGNISQLSVNEGLFKALQDTTGERQRIPQAPVIARDSDALQAALNGVNVDTVDSTQVAGAISFDTLTGESPATPEAAFQQWEKALSLLLEKVADSQKRRSDAKNFEMASQEMAGNPGFVEMARYFEKAYGGDKAIIVMDKILDIAGAKVEEFAARFEFDQSLENGLQLAVMAEQYQMMKNFRKGAASEAGRMLRMVRISRNDPRMADKMAATIQALGGQKKLEAMATAIQNARDHFERDLVVEGASKAKFTDMLVEYVTEGMLWGPSTHFVNFLSNATNLGKAVLEKGYAESTNRSGPGIANGETFKYMFGIWQAFGGLRRMWSEHRSEHSSWRGAVGNLGQMWNNADYGFAEAGTSGEMRQAITGQNVLGMVDRGKEALGLSTQHNRASGGLSSAIDLIGRYLGFPYAALEHSDKLFKYVSYVAELHAQAHRASNGDTDAFSRMMAAPPADLKRACMDHAKELTLQQDLGKTGQMLNQLRIEHPALRLFVPFLKTPINILKEGISMTPYVNRILGDFQQRLNSSDPAVRQMAEAKLMVGNLIWGTAVMLASAGYLTGPGPGDSDERRKQMATGKRFNAIHIGDQYYQIDRLDPLAAVFNSAAFVTEIVDNVDHEDFSKAMWAGMAQTLRLFTNRTYIESFSDILNLIMDPERNAGEAARRLGGMLVPASGLMRTANRYDPLMREAGDFQSALMQNIPGLSQALPERRDFLGQPIKNNEYLGPKWLSPFQVGTENKDPLYQEINRLHGLGLSAAPMPRRTFT